MLKYIVLTQRKPICYWHQIAKCTQLEEQIKSLEETTKGMIHRHNLFVDNVITFMTDLDKSSLLHSYKKAIDNLPKEKWLEPDAPN